MTMKFKDFIVYLGIRSFLGAYSLLMLLADKFGPKKKAVEGRGFRVLLTGQFYSSNWILAHLRPLAMSPLCEEVWVVTSYPVPKMEKVGVYRPPVWLVRLLGATLARLVSFVAVAVKERSDVVGGFHLLLNGLTASLVSRIIGARSLYFCVGGPAEVLEGGILSENRLFEKLKKPHALIENNLLKWVSTFDIVIAMGNSAVQFFKFRNVESDLCIIPGGLDTDYFKPSLRPARFDLIFVGRLVPIKRVDVFLESVRIAKVSRPGISAAVVGDGPLLKNLQDLSVKMKLAGNVHFAGFQADIAPWLNQARIFVLTSISEGLSLAMMEAMACGLPAVVPKTGDLGDLVVDQVNGHLIDRSDPQIIADCILKLLDEPEKLSRFSRSARQAAERLSIRNAVEKWNRVFESKRYLPNNTMDRVRSRHVRDSWIRWIQ